MQNQGTTDNGANIVRDGVSSTLSKFSQDVSMYSYVLSDKYNFIKPLIPNKFKGTNNYFFVPLQEAMLSFCDNYVDTEVNFSILKSGYVKEIRPILARLSYGRKFHFLYYVSKK